MGVNFVLALKQNKTIETVTLRNNMFTDQIFLHLYAIVNSDCGLKQLYFDNDVNSGFDDSNNRKTLPYTKTGVEIVLQILEEKPTLTIKLHNEEDLVGQEGVDNETLLSFKQLADLRTTRITQLKEREYINIQKMIKKEQKLIKLWKFSKI